ncbi:SdpI family protein [Clostridium senegalense]|uniref:SdpI family protein n=1 Tax=Clostridium senegalense TaxID=1465809 RepID=UPI000288BCC3|nr:SdpI family protein [Clostridium senegalense]
MIALIGIICIVIGFIFKAFPPRKINRIYGYRTKLSMKNEDTWNVAQKYSANTFIILGFIYLALEFILNQLSKTINVSYENIIILIGLVIMIILDEMHLKKFLIMMEIGNYKGGYSSFNLYKYFNNIKPLFTFPKHNSTTISTYIS